MKDLADGITNHPFGERACRWNYEPAKNPYDLEGMDLDGSRKDGEKNDGTLMVLRYIQRIKLCWAKGKLMADQLYPQPQKHLK